MDLIAFLLAAAGLALTADGFVLVGGAAFFVPLIALAVGLARRASMMTVLPFSFASHIVASVLWLGFVLIVRNRSEVLLIGSIAFVVYHFVCISLREKKVRHGRGGWTTTDAHSHPVAYWLWMTLFTALAAVVLVALFLRVARYPGPFQ
jgi:hypothetical protein